MPSLRSISRIIVATLFLISELRKGCSNGELSLHPNSFSSGASLTGKAVLRQAESLLLQCSQQNRHEPSPCLKSCSGAHMQPQPQKKLAQAYRIDGSIVLYRKEARNLFKAERSLLRAEPWWSMVFGAPLFVGALL